MMGVNHLKDLTQTAVGKSKGVPIDGCVSFHHEKVYYAQLTLHKRVISISR